MKNYFLYGALGIAIGFTACTRENQEVAQASLSSTTTNEQMGKAKFYHLADGKMKMDLEINIPERADSTVAVHFHEHGDCGNMGENTHGHWNPTNEPHGKWGSAAYHSGDIGNIALDSKGRGFISVSTDRWSTVDHEAKNIIGRAIIIHGGTDDYVTQPTGNSGPRIGCGVITAIK
jgi:superoxide dismutase, Cu-Zn family